MEVATEFGEIHKHFIIKEFSKYQNIDDSICKVIPVNFENFRSYWEVIIFPMYSNHPQQTSPIDCDIVIKLACLSSSTSPLVTQSLSIVTSVKGKELSNTELHPVKGKETPTWQGVLISRVTYAYAKLGHNDNLEFNLKFTIAKEILDKSEDGKIAVAQKLEILLRDPHYFDVCLMSCTHSKFYVHSSILHARSNIMRMGKPYLGSCNRDLSKPSPNKQENDPHSSESASSRFLRCNKNNILEFGTDSSCISSSSEEYNNTSVNNRAPLFTCSITPPVSSEWKSPHNLNSPQAVLSPRKRDSSYASPKTPQRKQVKITNSTPLTQLASSPMKQDSRCPSPRTPQRRQTKKSSTTPLTPSKVVQLQLTQFFPASLNHVNESDKMKGHSELALYSPTKDQVSSLPSLGSYPSSPIDKSLNERKNNLDALGGKQPPPSFQTLRRKLFDENTEEQKLKVLKLNMSTSVLQELLNWIYTGESPKLHQLCRPLLVAALRHEILDLARAAQLHLASLLSLTNVVDMLLLGHKYNAKLLSEEAMCFALSQANDVTKGDAWEAFALQYPRILLKFTKRLAARKI